MKSSIRLAGAMLVLCAASASAQHLKDFAYVAQIQLTAEGALHQARITPEVYWAGARRDLGDLRVFNAAGELVPHAFVRDAGPKDEERAAVELKFFPLHGNEVGRIDNINLRVTRSTDGSLSTVVSSSPEANKPDTLLGYLIDASKLERPLANLRFTWVPDVRGTNTRVDIQSSDDLVSWHLVVPQRPLLQLRHGDGVIERDTVEFHARRAKYFRVSWYDNAPPIQLQRVSAGLAQTVREPDRDWALFKGRQGVEDGEFVFELSAGAPMDRLRIQVPQANTIAPVSLWVREREGDKWRLAGRTVAYRLGGYPNEILNTPIVVRDAARYWMLKTDPRAGGFGAGDPILHAGWVPHRIVFNARGSGPFVLAVGNSQMSSAALPMETLVPGYGTPQAYSVLLASVQELKRNPSSTVEGRAGDRFGREPERFKRMVLWAALIVAVLTIAFMAWRLWRQLPGKR
jgi:hypothetical protein